MQRNVGRHSIQLWNGSSAYCWLVPFDAGTFENGMFKEFAIACPNSILRSVQHRQAEFFHGRLAARLTLQDLDIGNFDVVQGAHREPIWPSNVVGSITHNRTLAAAVALTSNQVGGIGIDIESIGDRGMCDALASVVFDKAELALLKQLPTPLPLLLTAAFSAKESFYKAVFNQVRRVFDFDALRLVGIDLERNLLSFVQQYRLGSFLHEGTYHTIQFSVLAPDTILSVFSVPPEII